MPDLDELWYYSLNRVVYIVSPDLDDFFPIEVTFIGFDRKGEKVEVMIEAIPVHHDRHYITTIDPYTHP